MQTIYLDISNKGVIPCVYAKQSEVGRKFLAVITDSGVPYEIQSDSVVSVWYEGASGKGNYTEIGERSAISVTKNRITVELIAQMLAVPGNGVITVLINSANGDQIGLWNIDYCVESVAGIESEKAEEYYTAFSQSVASLAQSAETIEQKQDRIDAIIKSKNATAAGLIYPLASPNVPSGFLLCDGAEYSRVEFAELFEAIGTTYGEGDGDYTFNVPNLMSRVPVGRDEDAGFLLGDSGGEAEHTLTVEEMPAHAHNIETRYPKAVPSVAIQGGVANYHNQDWWETEYVKTEIGGGRNQPHNIMQPYTVVNYIISTGKEIEFIVGGIDEAGGNGIDGTTFYPYVSTDGVISWTNNGGKENPEPVDLVNAVISALPIYDGEVVDV